MKDRCKKLRILCLILLCILLISSCSKNPVTKEKETKEDKPKETKADEPKETKENEPKEMPVTEENVTKELNVKENKYRYCSAERVDLTGKLGLKEESSHLRVLDITQEQILFSLESKRSDRGLAEGILDKTDKLYVYNLKTDEMKLLTEFSEKMEYINSGIIKEDTYLLLSFQLGEKDDAYVVYEIKEGNVKTIYEKTDQPLMNSYPSLFLINKNLLLAQPVITKEHTVQGSEIFQYKEDSFVKVALELPKDFLPLDTTIVNDSKNFITLWEDTSKKQAHFVIGDETKIKQIVPFPKDLRIMSYALNGDFLYISVQLENSMETKMFVVSLKDKQSYLGPFPTAYRMNSLKGKDKMIYVEYDFALHTFEWKDEVLTKTPIGVLPTDKSIIGGAVLTYPVSENTVYLVYANGDVFKLFLDKYHE